MFDAVSLAIPGAKNVQQAQDNALAADIPAFGDEVMARTQDIYDEYIKDQVHLKW
jgi:aryl-alcohol dehydrogenase-like predicted oxidoreductase